MGPLELALDLLAPPFCWACAGRARRGEPLCAACRGELRWRGAETVLVEGVEVWAPVAYEGPARALVRGLKFHGATGLAEPLAAQIAAAAPAGLLRPPAVLVPVPAHPRRARVRGYDQAALLAAALGRRGGLAVAGCLRRHDRGGGRQVGRTRGQRLAGLAGAIAVRPGVPAPRRAVLVDDVVTTGATVAACAGALAAAGVEEVAAVAYALTPGR
ncbi:MAG: ComF family protein [Solirubrobacterales bacterium]|nr:ComF family protein [Solirubrobacterales bacterium]